MREQQETTNSSMSTTRIESGLRARERRNATNEDACCASIDAVLGDTPLCFMRCSTYCATRRDVERGRFGSTHGGTWWPKLRSAQAHAHSALRAELRAVSSRQSRART